MAFQQNRKQNALDKMCIIHILIVERIMSNYKEKYT
jgi:hypothetical protein